MKMFKFLKIIIFYTWVKNTWLGVSPFKKYYLIHSWSYSNQNNITDIFSKVDSLIIICIINTLNDVNNSNKNNNYIWYKLICMLTILTCNYVFLYYCLLVTMINMAWHSDITNSGVTLNYIFREKIKYCVTYSRRIFCLLLKLHE